MAIWLKQTDLGESKEIYSPLVDTTTGRDQFLSSWKKAERIYGPSRHLIPIQIVPAEYSLRVRYNGGVGEYIMVNPFIN